MFPSTLARSSFPPPPRDLSHTYAHGPKFSVRVTYEPTLAELHGVCRVQLSPAFRRRILFHHSSEFSHPRPLLSIVSPSLLHFFCFLSTPVFSRFITPFSRTVLFSCPPCFAVPFRTFLSSYICASSMVHPPSDHIRPKEHLRPTGIMFVRTYVRTCVRAYVSL